MTGEYETMGRDELLVRIKDSIAVGNDRARRIVELEVELDVLRAAAREFVSLNEQGQQAALGINPILEEVDLDTEEGRAAAVAAIARHRINELATKAARAEANLRSLLDGADT